MREFRKFLMVSVAVGALTFAGAHAADVKGAGREAIPAGIYARATPAGGFSPFDGFYAGVHTSFSHVGTDVDLFTEFENGANDGDFTFDDNFTGDGIGVGVQAGFNRVGPNGLLLGIEASGSLRELESSISGNDGDLLADHDYGGIDADFAVFDTSIDSLAMIEAKAGYADERMALYGKAGVTVGRVITGLAVDGHGYDGDWHLEDGSEDFIAGLTVGAAGEAMLTDNISAFLSYNAIFYGDQSYSGPSDIQVQDALDGDLAISTWDTTSIEHLIRFGVNYHFGAGENGSDLSYGMLPAGGFTPFDGVYAGVHTSFSHVATDADLSSVFGNGENDGDFAFEDDFTGQGYGVGVQAGFNYVGSNGLLLGIEASGSLRELESSISGNDGDLLADHDYDGIDADLAVFDTSIDSLAMIEAKAGYANERMALYGKAGVTVGRIVTGLAVDGHGYDGDWHLEDGSEDYIAGLTVGAAGEAMLTDNISAFLSYNAIFYGEQSYRGLSDIGIKGASDGETAVSSWDTTAIEHLIRFGVNYHYGAEANGSDLSYGMLPAGGFTPFDGVYAGVHTSFSHVATDVDLFSDHGAGDYDGNFTIEDDFTGQGYGVGVQAGFNYVGSNGLLLGIEASGSLRELESTLSQTDGEFADKDFDGLDADLAVFDTSIDSLAMIEAKAGYANEKMALYGKAGVTVGRVVTGLTVDGIGYDGDWTLEDGSEDFIAGLTVGAAGEAMLTDNISAFLSYNAIFYGDQSYRGHSDIDQQQTLDGEGAISSWDTTAIEHLIRFGMNYHFGAETSGSDLSYSMGQADGFVPFDGFYAGLHTSFSHVAADADVYSQFDTRAADGDLTIDDDFSGEGFGVGVQAGFNYVGSSGLLLGVEASGSLRELESALSQTDGEFADHTFDRIDADLATLDMSIDSLAMVEGKAGYANEKIAIYGKAGVAVGKVVTGLLVDGYPGSNDGDWALEDGSEDFIAGLTVGAAGEAMLTDNVSTFLSYNAIFYGDQSYSGLSDFEQPGADGGRGIASWDTTAIEHLIRFGVNYHFD